MPHTRDVSFAPASHLLPRHVIAARVALGTAGGGREAGYIPLQRPAHRAASPFRLADRDLVGSSSLWPFSLLHRRSCKGNHHSDPEAFQQLLYGTGEVFARLRARFKLILRLQAVVSWVRSLALRFYCESRTTYWVILDDKELERRKLEWQENKPPPTDLAEAVTRTMSRGSALKKDQKRHKKEQDAVRWSNEPEWARATFGEISLVAQGGIQTVGAEEQSDRFIISFQFQLPTELSFDEWNYHQGADRSQHRTLRPSPPSVRDAVDASVEWVVEAVLDLRWASRSNLATPMHHSPTASEVSLGTVSTSSFDQDQLDPWRNSRGFLLSKPSRIVHRKVLPVICADAASKEHDLSDEKVGSFAAAERAALRSHAGRLSVGGKDAAKEKSQSWMKVIELRSKALGTVQGHLTVEVGPVLSSRDANSLTPPVGQLIAHKPLYLPRTNLRGSLSLYLDWNAAAKRRFGVGKSATDGVRIEQATLAVDCWRWSKGGSGKVKKSSTALRFVPPRLQCFIGAPSLLTKQQTAARPAFHPSLSMCSFIFRRTLQGPRAVRSPRSPRSRRSDQAGTELQDGQSGARGELRPLPSGDLALTETCTVHDDRQRADE